MENILFEQVTVGGVTLRNRIFMSAAACYNADATGDIDYGMPMLHFAVAKGGCALVPTGGVSGVHPSGRTNATRPMFDSDERIPSFRAFAEGVRRGGAAAVLQVTHGGAGAASYQLSLGRKPFVASHYPRHPKEGLGEVNREAAPATEEEIFEVIAAFGDAAVRARRAGFDGIQVHAAHESLLSQWLSPLYNLRNDAWGGSVENRCRLHCEIVREIKRWGGVDFMVIVKLGIEDTLAGGTVEAEGIRAATLLAAQGNVDIIEVSQGLQNMDDMERTCLRPHILSTDREAYFRTWAGKVRAAVRGGALVTLQGGLRTPSLMEEILQRGEADFVSLCRPYIREPGLVNRWAEGDRSRAKCISCNRCLWEHLTHGKPLACVFSDTPSEAGRVWA